MEYFKKLYADCNELLTHTWKIIFALLTIYAISLVVKLLFGHENPLLLVVIKYIDMACIVSLVLISAAAVIRYIGKELFKTRV